MRSTVISQLRKCARALAKEWECRSDKSGKSQDEPNSSQRPYSNLELLAIAYTSRERQIVARSNNYLQRELQVTLLNMHTNCEGYTRRSSSYDTRNIKQTTNETPTTNTCMTYLFA